MLAEESGMEKRSSSFAEKNVDLEGMRGVPPTSGLTRAVASCSLGSIRQRREISPKASSLPRPIPLHSQYQSSKHSLDAFGRSAGTEAGIAELESLLASDHLSESPTPKSYFGVSPPVRSGAANPLGHSSAFSRVAPVACRRNLQILEQMQVGPATGLTPTGDRGLLHPSPCEGKSSPFDVTSSFNDGRSFYLFPSSLNRTSVSSGRCSPNPHRSVSPTSESGKIRAGC